MNHIQEKYLRRAKVVALLLQIVPFVRMVGLNGSLARGEAKKTSDIDFLIITKKGRIWTCRALVTLATHLTGQRRYGLKVAGRICLNRYQTDKFLEIRPHNHYHRLVFSNLIPLVDIEGTYLKYFLANRWMKDWVKQIKFPEISAGESRIMRIFRKIGEKILEKKLGDFLEKRFKNFQRKRILTDIRTLRAPKGRVRISDQELCFHPLKE